LAKLRISLQIPGCKDFKKCANPWPTFHVSLPSAYQKDRYLQKTVYFFLLLQVVQHDGGHLPFECEMSRYLHFDHSNRLTIAVNNTLTPTTLPPGRILHYSKDDGYPVNYFTQVRKC